jgi:isoquinoline 1-oxidoreductase subunit beta
MAPGEFPLTAWVRITADNQVTLVVSQAEIGQGISTTLPAILADELGAEWDSVKLQTAPYAQAYRNPLRNWMFTGNSESMQSFHDLMLQMGAAAREMLTQAAATRLHVPGSSLRAEKGAIVHVPSGRRLTFGELAADAARLPVPEKPRLRPPGEHTLVGRSLARVDIPAKVDGSGGFGIDFHLTGMLVAAVRTAPTLGGRLLKVDDSVVKSMPGVAAVVPLDKGVAVVAETYWRARRALARLQPEWDPGPDVTLSSEGLRAEYRRVLDAGPWAKVVDSEAVEPAIAAAAKSVTADYDSPFLAHATLEPMNCTASVTADGCDIWAPTQGQELAFFALKATLGLRDDQIRVNRTPYVGGGFGRRLLPDFVVQAALVSKAVGRPVKVIWDREEDMRRDQYRPATMVRLTAALDAAGKPKAVAARVVSPTILLPVFPPIEAVLREKGVDPSALEGMSETIYDLPDRRVEFHLFKTAVPTSVMRTTGYGPNVFALESFIDELARSAGADPVQYRRGLLTKSPRALHVLERARALSDWDKPLPPSQGRGVAVTEAFKTFLAQVIEVAVDGSQVRVSRVVSVADCGRVLDPGIALSNVQAGVIFGLSYCKSEITFDRGAVVQRNFDGYELPYLSESPDLVTELVSGGGEMGGIGEVGPVTVPAALANAIFAATGRRLRSMPLSRHGLTFGVVRPPRGEGNA